MQIVKHIMMDIPLSRLRKIGWGGGIVFALFLLFFVSAFVPRSINLELLTEAEQSRKALRIRTVYLIIIDYSLPITVKRLWVVKDRTVLLNTWVSHAMNTGILYATDYSNEPGTNKSCYGSFVTQDKFQWHFEHLGMTLNTPALHVRGLDEQNSNARVRGIYFHKTYFPLIWSWGCFATLPSANQWITEHCENTFVYVRK